MLNQLTHVTVWVNDQDEALAFYTETLGMEVRDDTTIPEMSGFRWLTVGPAKQPGLRLILVTPGAPVIDGELAAQLTELIAKGAAGTLHFSTDDCRAAHAELKRRGVDFSMEPTEMPYGIDAQLRDPVRSCPSLASVAIAGESDDTQFTIDSATTHDDDGSCRVEISATHPPAGDDVTIWIWLPLAGWNGRFQGNPGGAGFSGGSQEALAGPLQAGYAAPPTPVTRGNGSTGALR
jgi:catechol 2,3-dioxygenase-like lactoylglutathione lyase family enzyme